MLGIPSEESSLIYVESNFERNHQGLDNELIDKTDSAGRTLGALERKERLGGLLSY
jgi:hypothetical protein